MNYDNEPVAWIGKNDLMNICHKHPYVSRDKILDDDIPFYTHPAKTLTDFEIMQISAGYPDRLYFAKAIIRKAQEK